MAHSKCLGASPISTFRYWLEVRLNLSALSSLDGVPINENGMTGDRVLWTDHVFLPPAARVEFIFKGLVGRSGRRGLITRSVDTGPAGENDPARSLADIVVSDAAPEPLSRLAVLHEATAKVDLCMAR